MFSVGVSRVGARNDNLAAIKDAQLHIYYVVGGVKKYRHILLKNRAGPNDRIEMKAFPLLPYMISSLDGFS
jgi:hypothetical protein